MNKILAILSLLTITSTVFAADASRDFLLCRVTGMNDIAYKVSLNDVKSGLQCPIILPTKLSDFEFRVSRQTSSGDLRLIVENKITHLRQTALGAANEASLSVGLTKEDGAKVAKEVGYNDGLIYEEVSVSCAPNFGFQSEYYKAIDGNNNCYKK